MGSDAIPARPSQNWVKLWTPSRRCRELLSVREEPMHLHPVTRSVRNEGFYVSSEEDLQGANIAVKNWVFPVLEGKSDF